MSADKPEDKGEKPKIVVDEDWKASAQAEKEKLASQEKATSARAGPAGGPAASAAGGPQARSARLDAGGDVAGHVGGRHDDGRPAVFGEGVRAAGQERQ